jgi:prepilin-type N-terminal cleavage/methylation domain-containing protein
MHAQRKHLAAGRAAFTLVELLVVITIIGILVALITTAAIGALRTARQAALKTEVEQISASFEKYKDTAGSYPPNLVTDADLDNNQVLADLQRHMRQAFPRHKESDNLLRLLAGFAATGTDAADYPNPPLTGGMTAAEAVVFWLSGFSSDPQYPISGEGGPAYVIPAYGNAQNRTLDPLESRKWIYQFEITRLGPRGDDNYFDQSNDRFIEYTARINGTSKRCRINFWQYTPGRSKLQALYFDVSRHPAAVIHSSGTSVLGPYDPPASTIPGQELHVHALKTRNQSADVNEPPATPLKVPPIRFANEGKFQILHCGIDDEWGDEILDRTSAHGVEEAMGLAKTAYVSSYLLFPTGPFTDATADTIANFVTQSRLEDAQPQ